MTTTIEHLDPQSIAGGKLSYFNHCRDDILKHVPGNSRNVLSIGCGAGATEAELIKRGVSVTGIELNPSAAAAARARGIQVIESDAGLAGDQLDGQDFDCMIFADVLEHLRQPSAVVRGFSHRLKNGSRMIISVPNFRHLSVFLHLFVGGVIPYCDAGIFDRTHLRITTRKMAERWLTDAGLRTIGVDYRISLRREKLIVAASAGILREFLARQVIVVGEK